MAFRRARAESFLNPWAQNESVELISLDPDEAHKRLVEHAVCDMLIYSVGAPSPMKSLPRFRYYTPFAVMRRLPSSPTMKIPPPFSPQSAAGPRVTSAIPWRPSLRCRPFRSSCTAVLIFRRPPFWPAGGSARRRPSNTDSLTFPRSNRFRGLNNKRRRRLSDRRTAFTNRKPPFSTTRRQRAA